MEILLEEIHTQHGCKLVAPLGFTHLKNTNKDEWSYICNGCGAGSALVDLVPDNLLFLDIVMVCHIHDYSQQMCPATNDEFLRQNRIFMNNMIRVVNKNSNRTMIPSRRWMANRYYKAVNIYGASTFQDLKNIENELLPIKKIEGADQY